MSGRWCAILLALAVGGRGLVAAPPRPDGDSKLRRALTLLEILWEADPDSAAAVLHDVSEKSRAGEFSDELKRELRGHLADRLTAAYADGLKDRLATEAALLAASWGEPTAIQHVERLVGEPSIDTAMRVRGLESLAAHDAAGAARLWRPLIESTETSAPFRELLIGVSADLPESDAAPVLIRGFDAWKQHRTAVLDALTARSASALQLLKRLEQRPELAGALNANHLRKLAASSDARVREQTKQRWGAVRSQRDPRREQVVAQVATSIDTLQGDRTRGSEVFRKTCAACHRIRGQGQDVGPDLTANGRSTRAQLLSNIFDPSLVIGVAYQARTIRTADGRVVTGLLAEQTADRWVLKQQGGKRVRIARDNVEEVRLSQLSLMPEGFEKQLTPQQIADLIEFLSAD